MQPSKLTPGSDSPVAFPNPATVASAPLFQTLSETTSQEIQGGYWSHYRYQGTAIAAYSYAPAPVVESYAAPLEYSPLASHQIAANHLDSVLLA